MNPFLSFFLLVGVMGRPYPPIWTYNYGVRRAEPQFWRDPPPARQDPLLKKNVGL